MGRCLKWLDGCRRRAGKPARMASVARAGARKSGPRVEEVAAGGAPGGVAVCLCFPAIRGTCRGVLQCAFRRSASPHKRGGKLKAHLARRRENADVWLREIVDRKYSARATCSCPGRD